MVKVHGQSGEGVRSFWGRSVGNPVKVAGRFREGPWAIR